MENPIILGFIAMLIVSIVLSLFVDKKIKFFLTLWAMLAGILTVSIIIVKALN